MKNLFLSILIILSNLLVHNGTAQTALDEGAVKIIFIDTLAKDLITPSDCYITYNKDRKPILYSDIVKDNYFIRHVKSGIYTFYIQSKDYKYIVITDVEVFSDKTTYLYINELVPKKSIVDSDTIKIKWHIPILPPRSYNTFNPIYQIPRSADTPSISPKKINETPK